MAEYYKYKVTDKKTGKVILNNANYKEVSNKIGIKSKNISSYVIEGMAYRRRFIIERISNKDDKKRRYTLDKRKWISEWNDIREAAELLRTGKGKIVRKKVKGKWKRYTEVTG